MYCKKHCPNKMECAYHNPEAVDRREAARRALAEERGMDPDKVNRKRGRRNLAICMFSSAIMNRDHLFDRLC
jgi:hypothetical protein